MAWQRPTSLNEWLGIILRHRKKFALPALAVMIAVFWASHAVPREYLAESKFQRINDSALVQMGSSANLNNLFVVRRQLNEDIKGRPAIEQLVHDLQLTRNLPHTADGQLTAQGQLAFYDLVTRLGKQINVYFQTQSDQVDVVVVTCKHSNPQMASKIANQVAENYIRKTRAQLDEMLLNAKSFFQTQVTTYRSRVQEIESKKLQFELENPGLQPNDPSSVQTRLVELRAKLDATTESLNVAIQKRTKLYDFVQNQPEFLETKQRGLNPAVAELLKRKADLETQLDQHRAAGRRDAHPEVRKLTRSIQELQQKADLLEREVDLSSEQVPNGNRLQAIQAMETLNGEVVALERQRDLLAAQVEAFEQRNRNFFVIRNEYVRMQRDLDEAVQSLSMWENNLRTTNTALTAEVGQRGVRLSFIQRAPELGRPAKPTFLSIVTVALGAGLGIGIAMIALAELLDGSYHSIAQAVDSLKLPVLGSVNEIVTPAAALRQRVFDWGVYPAIAGLMLIILLISMMLTYLSLNDPDQFRQIIHQPKSTAQQWIAPP